LKTANPGCAGVLAAVYIIRGGAQSIIISPPTNRIYL
jgi:hypothetical protein